MTCINYAVLRAQIKNVHQIFGKLQTFPSFCVIYLARIAWLKHPSRDVLIIITARFHFFSQMSSLWNIHQKKKKNDDNEFIHQIFLCKRKKKSIQIGWSSTIRPNLLNFL